MKIASDTATRQWRKDVNSSLGANDLPSGSHEKFTQPSLGVGDNNQAIHQIFHFPEYYYHTQKIEGVPGTVYWRVPWEFKHL